MSDVAKEISKDKISIDPQIDTSNTTVSAFRTIDAKKQLGKILAPNSEINQITTNVNETVRVKVHTPFDDRTHTYFHSLSIDKEITDFMGTAELRCPYDSDIMGYWEPSRAYCVIYGTNKGKYKILFIGRVREVNQIGYEISIVLQDYGWKFKQLVTQAYANDNVIGKDGYTILKLIFQALKIDSWVVSPAAKYRLKQVGIDSDGNVTVNKQQLDHIPDLLKRLKRSDPRKSINKYTAINKAKESELHNIQNINYTLRYEKPTKAMRNIAKQNNYKAGQNVYSSNYGNNSGKGSGGSKGSSSKKANKASAKISASGHPRPPNSLCNNVKSSTICSALKLVWAYNRGYANDFSMARNAINDYASTYPAAYRSQARPVLATMAKYCIRSDRRNAAQIILSSSDAIASKKPNGIVTTNGQRKAAAAIARKTSTKKNNNPFSPIWNFLTRR